MVDWLEIGQTSGHGDKLILVRATENETTSARTTSLVLSGSTKSINIPVNQAVTYIDITPDFYNFKVSGGTAEFRVKSNARWRVSQCPDWITLSQTSGYSGTFIITATCATNTEYEPRVSGITVYNSVYSKSASTIITQDEKIRPLVIDPTQLYIPKTGGTRTFQVTSTSPWSISGSTIGTISPSSGTEGSTTVTVTISSENTGDTLIKNTFYVYNAEDSIPVTVRQATYDYLTFEVTEAGVIKTKWSDDWNKVVTVYMSIDGGAWSIAPTSTTVSAGVDVQFRATTNYIDKRAGNLFEGSTCGFNLRGNIMSLVDAVDFENIIDIPETTYGYFQSCFKACGKLYSIDNLKLPATGLTDECYYEMFESCIRLSGATISLPATALTYHGYSGMFKNCKELTTAPALPATTLGRGCYSQMFEGCTALTTAPTLQATALERDCYQFMFSGCTSLTTAPDLPASTLSYGCYQYMFQGCTALTTAPILSAQTLAEYSYRAMFSNCSSLNYVKCLAVNHSANYCTTDWLKNVAADGTFVKASGVSWSTGVDGIPAGWTVEEV